MMCAGVPVPFSQWAEGLGLDGVLTEDFLDSVASDSMEELNGMLGVLQSSMEDEDRRMALLTRAREISHEAYAEIAKLAVENPGWRHHLKMRENQAGEFGYVKKEN